MSSVVSAQHAASLVDMDRPSDPVNAPMKPFSRDSSSASPSPPNSQSSRKSSPPRSPPLRPGKPDQILFSLESKPSAPVNGHVPDHTPEKRQVPSQGSPQLKTEDGEHIDRGKEDSEWEDQPVPQGSDLDEDPDFESGESDGDWTQDEIDGERRVKVYELIDQKWTDRGTAFCQGDYDESLREAKLIARSEHSNEILLECIIRTSDVYQRQQETLIVWTEPDGTDYALSFQDIEGCTEVWEFILEVQRHLLKDKAEEQSNTSEGSSSMQMLSAGTMNPFTISTKLPMPALGNIPDCERSIRQNSRLPHGKEKLCDVLMQMDYVKHIIDVMKQAEDLEDIKELHACCSCMQTILMLNDHNLLEYVLQDHIFSGVVGVLEYDPEFPTHKAFYRDFLEKCTQFRQPIPIREVATRQKIEQTYRLQFLKDVVLARATDDATFNVLNSCIIFNQIDIVNQVQHDERFLREVVGLFLTTSQVDAGKEKGSEALKGEESTKTKGKQKAEHEDVMDVDEEPKVNGMHTDGSTPASPEIGPTPALMAELKPSSGAESSYSDEYNRRKDTLLLIQQLCVMGKNVQLPARLQLFRTLVDRGILHAVQWAIGRPERQMISTAGEVLTVLLDHDINGVRQHVMKQVALSSKPTMGMSATIADQDGDAAGGEGKRETLVETLCRLLSTSPELAYKSQMADAIRALLEVPQSDNTDTANMAAFRAIARAKDDPVTERFLEYFYTKCCEGLFRPMSELPDHRKVMEPNLPLSRDRSNLYLFLCDLLSSFALQHSYRSHFFIVSSSTTKSPLVPRIASLLRAREKHLRLAALRFFRACLKLGNRNMALHLIHCDVLVRILELTARESKWDNLLSSCCQEFFEHIRRENIKELLTHLMTKYEAEVQELAHSPVCGERFQNLIRRWEMNNEPPPKESVNSHATSVPGQQKWGQGRLLEQEEEEYFNNSDDEDTTKASQWQATPSASAPSLGSSHISNLKRRRAKGFTTIITAPPRQPRKINIVPPRLPLVDYDDEEADSSSSSGEVSPKSGGTATAAHETSSQPLQTGPIDWFSPSQTPPLSSLSKGGAAADDDDDGPLSDSPSRLMRLGSPPRMGEKRRRSEEDDEDELLERLVRSKRQQTAGSSSDKEESKPALIKSAPPGKMKLKLGATSLSMASTSSSADPLEKGTKDVDSG